MRDDLARAPTVSYTTVDENDATAQTVLSPSGHTKVFGVFCDNQGSTAVALLEVTDGSNTANVTTGQTGGDAVEFTGEMELSPSDSLAINVTTAEGSDLNETAAVIHADQT